MKLDEHGNKVYLTPEADRKKALDYYHQNRAAILERRRELEKLNGDQQKRNRKRWAARNRKKLREHQQRFRHKRSPEGATMRAVENLENSRRGATR